MPDELPITAALAGAADAAEVVVEVSGLGMPYDGFEVIRGIDLRVPRGEIFTFLVRNAYNGEHMDHLAVFSRLYEGFNRRDVDGVLAMMSEDVDWPNAWKGGRIIGREAVRHYWIAQWAEIDPHVEPLSVTERADGSVAVTVRQVVRSVDGELLGDAQVVHVYGLDEGLISRMDVEEPEP